MNHPHHPDSIDPHDMSYDEPLFLDPKKKDAIPDGWKAEESLCVFELHFSDKPANSGNSGKTGEESVKSAKSGTKTDKTGIISGEMGEVEAPTLLRYKPLTGPLLKAVTSAKLSPQGRYALIGYGVRSQGVVEDHVHSMVASEVRTGVLVVLVAVFVACAAC
jgi:hypothetical protein